MVLDLFSIWRLNSSILKRQTNIYTVYISPVFALIIIGPARELMQVDAFVFLRSLLTAVIVYGGHVCMLLLLLLSVFLFCFYAVVSGSICCCCFRLMLFDVSVLPSKFTSKSCYGDHLSIEKGVCVSYIALARSEILNTYYVVNYICGKNHNLYYIYMWLNRKKMVCRREKYWKWANCALKLILTAQTEYMHCMFQHFHVYLCGVWYLS